MKPVVLKINLNKGNLLQGGEANESTQLTVLYNHQ